EFAQRFQRILGTAAASGCPLLTLAPAAPEVPEEQLVAVRPPGEFTVELFQLLDQSGLNVCLAGRAQQFGLPRIRETAKANSPISTNSQSGQSWTACFPLAGEYRYTSPLNSRS